MAGDRQALSQVSRLFLRLGFTAFGGPAAHIAMFRDEVVTRRHWLSDQEFLDLLGATNLIPGPNSTEMAIHIGRVVAGWRGLVAAGTLFILPAFGIVLAIAAAYREWGALPEAYWLLYGIKPVIIAIVLQALLGLGKTALRGWDAAIVATASALLYLLGFNELAILAAGTAAVAVVRSFGSWGDTHSLGGLLFIPGAVVSPLGVAGLTSSAVAPFSLATLFWTLLKIGSVLYGSGYVLLAFLRADFVERLGWLSEAQLLDAVAVGQFTPGPVFTTATFVGYLVGGLPGAVVATVGIFLPSFAFVAASAPLIARLRSSPLTAPLLDGVNATSLGLMAGVTLQLSRAAVVDVVTALLALIAIVVLWRLRPNSAWVVLAGGLVGVVAGQIQG